MTKILITGADGFVGENFVKRYYSWLRSNDALCYVYDRPEVLDGYRLKSKKVNLVNGRGLIGFGKAPRLIIHLAASTDTSYRDHRCNDVGTRNLLNSLGKLDKNTHFIYISTIAIFAGRRNCKIPIKESAQAAPTNEYGRTKLKAENFLIARCKKDNFRLTIVRLATVYGVKTRENRLFSIFKKLIKEKSFLAAINWPGLISLVHVGDVISALWIFTGNSPEHGKPEIYNISGDSLSLSGISHKMHRALGCPYREIKFPAKSWRIFSAINRYILYLEPVFPAALYNYFWRFSLIADNTLYSSNKKIVARFPTWEPRNFKDAVSDVVS